MILQYRLFRVSVMALPQENHDHKHYSVFVVQC
jgi:hypothetical protein